VKKRLLKILKYLISISMANNIRNLLVRILILILNETLPIIKTITIHMPNKTIPTCPLQNITILTNPPKSLPNSNNITVLT
jgi:uncharacterized protein YlaN (UPF0358 family)